MTPDGDTRSFEERLKKSAFYTPSSITAALSAWAIRDAKEIVLEPSFGGCGFLAATKNRLEDLGCVKANRNIFGCDIDQVAFDHLRLEAGLELDSGHFLKQDFLRCVPGQSFPTKFDVCIGNPPFLSRHRMTKRLRRELERYRKGKDLPLDRSSALWSYFLVHALGFMKKGARLAWVLPVSYLDSEYAILLRRHIELKFARVEAIKLPRRTQYDSEVGEPTIALLCDGFEQGPCITPSSRYVSDLSDLSSVVFSDESGAGIDQEMKAYADISKRTDICSLGSKFKISIGLVTGSNDFFVLRRSYVNEHRLPQSTIHRIVGSASHLEGLALSANDIEKLMEDDKRVLLLSASPKSADGKRVSKYLEGFPKKQREGNVTFAKRKYWFSPSEGRAPDAFLACMGQRGPRISINTAGIDCTNTLYRLESQHKLTLLEKQLLAISILSSFSALDAELRGRHYKSGSLKLEPSAAKAILLIAPQIRVGELSKFFKCVDASVRKRDWDGARKGSDRAIVELCGDLSLKVQLRHCSNALATLRSRRLDVRR